MHSVTLAQVFHKTELFEVPDSALLRSPTASQGEGGALGEAEARKRGNTVGIRDQAMDLAKLQGYKVSREADNLLPTPIVRDYKDGSAAQSRNGKVSTDTVARAIFNSGEVLLGTPRTSSANGSTPKQVAAGAPKARIEDQVLTTNWGKFEPAIRRWEETIDRPAPAPTKPDGKEGNHRLSSKFTEWMMGLPDGWITDIGLKRNDELKACGNGVVPQQAELALSLLGIKEILERS
jgi:DNA (cytosine-5)-methyltransferase 1